MSIVPAFLLEDKREKIMVSGAVALVVDVAVDGEQVGGIEG